MFYANTGSSLLLCATLLAVATVAQADGRTFYVANYGVDSPICGSRQKPCRSITQAMDNAVSGDTISVGAGRYGDVNGDGDLLDPGDERDIGLHCLVCVTKAVRIVSEKGIPATLIDATRTGMPYAVLVTGNGATFGVPGRGFRISGAPSTGLYVIANNVRIGGNVVQKSASDGFFIQGSTRLTDNIAVDNQGDGFAGRGSDLKLIRNTSVGNRGIGMVFIQTARLQMTLNDVDGNGQGVIIDGTEVTFTDNRVTNSTSLGIYVSAQLQFNSSVVNLREFSGNDVIGNRGPGVFIGRNINAVRLTRNNIFGNGTKPNVPAVETPPNCGLVNESRTDIVATNNFWGRASGPGADPADNVCDVGAATIFDPVAPVPF